MLVDAELRGLLVGMTLQTTPAEIYRALIEATAFGTRTIVDAFESAGVPVDAVVACGGLPERNTLLMQIYADVLGREISVGASTQAPALGAAMFGAVAAGEHATIEDAVSHMTRPGTKTYAPSAATHAVYDQLYGEYRRLHDLFGRGGDDVMRNPHPPSRRGGLQVEVPWTPAVRAAGRPTASSDSGPAFARRDVPLDVPGGAHAWDDRRDGGL